MLKNVMLALMQVSAPIRLCLSSGMTDRRDPARGQTSLILMTLRDVYATDLTDWLEERRPLKS